MTSWNPVPVEVQAGTFVAPALPPALSLWPPTKEKVRQEGASVSPVSLQAGGLCVGHLPIRSCRDTRSPQGGHRLGLGITQECSQASPLRATSIIRVVMESGPKDRFPSKGLGVGWGWDSFLFKYNFFVYILNDIQQCSGVTPGSALGDSPGGTQDPVECQAQFWSASCEADALPVYYPLHWLGTKHIWLNLFIFPGSMLLQ